LSESRTAHLLFKRKDKLPQSICTSQTFASLSGYLTFSTYLLCGLRVVSSVHPELLPSSSQSSRWGQCKSLFLSSVVLLYPPPCRHFASFHPWSDVPFSFSQVPNKYHPQLTSAKLTSPRFLCAPGLLFLFFPECDRFPFSNRASRRRPLSRRRLNSLSL